MTGQCKNENCFADTACALGYLDRTECELWNEPDDITGVEAEPSEKAPSDLPWNSYSLGTSDLTILAGRGHPVVLGLIGPPDSGKTSLLVYVYLWLLKHGRIGDWIFSGSWTLGGWETIVQNSRWSGEQPPSFPPHTSSAGRHPGLLHVTLRHCDTEEVRDVLFTDAPGEWFTRWARVPNDPTANGARWVIEHSNALLLLIDSEALADSTRLPQTRRATRELIERVSAVPERAPVFLVWTKSDADIPAPVHGSIVETCQQFMPDAVSCKVSVQEPESIEQCIADAISAAYGTGQFVDVDEPRLSSEPFLAFRGLDD